MPPRSQPTSPSPPPPARFPFTSGSFHYPLTSGSFEHPLTSGGFEYPLTSGGFENPLTSGSFEYPITSRSFEYPGSFDFPHASTSPRPRGPASRLDQLADFIHHRHREPDLRAEADGEAERDPAAQRQPRAEAFRPRPSRHAQREPPGSSLLPSASPTANRSRMPPSERYLRSRTRLRDHRSSIDPTNILDSLSDYHLNPIPSSVFYVGARSPTSEQPSQHRQAKRRKLDHDVSRTSEHDGFKYGYKGQVVPGRLKMDVVSCDGGEYERYSTERLYKVQNVLKNDKSVYCSESSRCNILLKHIGETSFCLEKVVIRAPDRGFTAPIQEGMIFVSMSQAKLLTGTSAYRIEYTSRSPRGSPGPISHPELLSLREAIDDPQVWDQSRPGMEDRIRNLRLRNHSSRAPNHFESFDDMTRQMMEQRAAINDEDDAATEYCPYHVEEGDPNAAGISAPTPPPFTITTESEHEDSDEGEALPSAAIMADRLRRESRWRPESDDEEDEDSLLHRFPPPRRAHPVDATEHFGEGRGRGNLDWAERRLRNSRHIDSIRAARLHGPSRIYATDKAFPGSLIAPHARFFIARHKNKITIKFHPAISGKYVLLKLWSPTPDGNIDMESVQFHGYSGPRFFPAVEPR